MNGFIIVRVFYVLLQKSTLKVIYYCFFVLFLKNVLKLKFYSNP